MADPGEWLRRLDRRAELRRQAGLTRTLRSHGPQPDDVVDLAGNDYLGLARHPAVIAAAEKALERYGLGATGSRLVRGSTDEHAALETELATLLRQPAALVFSSGYLANLGAIRAAARPRGVVLIDAHAHASLHDGCALAGVRTETVPHADPTALRRRLAERAGAPALVVTESVFSVDGDLAPLREIHAACRDFGAVLLVDDAHALGVLGDRGAGAVVAAGLAGEPDVVVTATLSKTLGAAGGIVAGPQPLIAHLVDGRRQRGVVDERAPGVDEVRDAGLDPGEPAAGIVSVTAPSADAALAWASACRERGVAVGCFRPPSTPDPRSRLRLTINAGIAASDFGRAVTDVIAAAP